MSFACTLRCVWAGRVCVFLCRRRLHRQTVVIELTQASKIIESQTSVWLRLLAHIFVRCSCVRARYFVCMPCVFGVYVFVCSYACVECVVYSAVVYVCIDVCLILCASRSTLCASLFPKRYSHTALVLAPFAGSYTHTHTLIANNHSIVLIVGLNIFICCT